MNSKQSLAYLLIVLEVVVGVLLYLYVSHISGVVLFAFGIATLFLIVREAGSTIEYTIPQFFDLISQTDMGQGLNIPNWRDLEKSNKELGHPKIQIEEIDEGKRIYTIYFKNETRAVWAMGVELLLNKTDPIENAVRAIYSPEINPITPSDIRYYMKMNVHGEGIKRAASELARGTGMKPEDVLSAIYGNKKSDKNETNK